jgi:glycosyltransferase involved in cell wall biosynthesis
LNKLQDQVTENLFTYSVVVVDNDILQSASETVRQWKSKSTIPIDYFFEPEQNISLARNKAVLNAKGDFIAMIDDDEVPENNWLLILFKAIHQSNSDGVLGPVRPSFPNQAPKWLIKSGLCERSSNITGKMLTRNDQLRTGNVLFKRKIFEIHKNLFEERYGRTGGEDVHFFHHRIEEGYSFTWCEEAPVYEEISPERMRLSFYLKKHIRMGGLTGEMMRKGTFPLWLNFIKSTSVSMAYPIFLPFLAVCGKHVFARHLMRFVYHFSRILGVFGVVLIRER